MSNLITFDSDEKVRIGNSVSVINFNSGILEFSCGNYDSITIGETVTFTVKNAEEVSEQFTQLFKFFSICEWAKYAASLSRRETVKLLKKYGKYLANKNNIKVMVHGKDINDAVLKLLPKMIPDIEKVEKQKDTLYYNKRITALANILQLLYGDYFYGRSFTI